MHKQIRAGVISSSCSAQLRLMEEFHRGQLSHSLPKFSLLLSDLYIQTKLVSCPGIKVLVAVGSHAAWEFRTSLNVCCVHIIAVNAD